MIYKDFKDKKLSALGMGAMRLPVEKVMIQKLILIRPEKW